MNVISLLGRLTRDPEMKTTGTGVEVTSFSVAVDRRFKDSDGKRQADFIECTAWRQSAAFICKYFHKGDTIGIVGSLQSRKWQDKEGNNRISWEVIVDNAYFGGNKSGGGAAESIQPTTANNYGSPTASIDVPSDDGFTAISDADLPF